MTGKLGPLSDRVPVAPLQAAYLETGLSPSEVAERLGWVSAAGKPDVSRLRRALGFVPQTTRGRKLPPTGLIRYGNAVLICRAINAVPREVGL